MFIAMIIAGLLFGAILPELLLILSANGKARIPTMLNIMSAIAFGIIFAFIAS